MTPANAKKSNCRSGERELRSALGPPTSVDTALRVSFPLSHDRVDIWAVDVSRLAQQSPSLEDALSEEERSRASRFMFAADRQRFVVGRALLRRVLGAHIRRAPQDVPIGRSDAGKPCLQHSPSGIAFNVSHSGGVVLLAFSARSAVGVDVELVRDGLDFAALAGTSFSARERAVVLGTPDGIAERFYRYWSCKESLMKADGRGFGLAGRAFSMVASDDPDSYGVESEDGPLPWRTHAFTAFDGYACAVTSDAGRWATRLLHVG